MRCYAVAWMDDVDMGSGWRNDMTDEESGTIEPLWDDDEAREDSRQGVETEENARAAKDGFERLYTLAT